MDAINDITINNTDFETEIDRAHQLLNDPIERWKTYYDRINNLKDIKNGDDENLLMFACMYSNDYVNYFISKGLDVNATNNEGANALYYIDYDNVSAKNIIETLIKNDINVFIFDKHGNNIFDHIKENVLPMSDDVESVIRSISSLIQIYIDYHYIDDKNFISNITNLYNTQEDIRKYIEAQKNLNVSFLENIVVTLETTLNIYEAPILYTIPASERIHNEMLKSKMYNTLKEILSKPYIHKNEIRSNYLHAITICKKIIQELNHKYAELNANKMLYDEEQEKDAEKQKKLKKLEKKERERLKRKQKELEKQERERLKREQEELEKLKREQKELEKKELEKKERERVEREQKELKREKEENAKTKKRKSKPSFEEKLATSMSDLSVESKKSNNRETLFTEDEADEQLFLKLFLKDDIILKTSSNPYEYYLRIGESNFVEKHGLVINDTHRTNLLINDLTTITGQIINAYILYKNDYNKHSYPMIRNSSDASKKSFLDVKSLLYYKTCLLAYFIDFIKSIFNFEIMNRVTSLELSMNTDMFINYLNISPIKENVEILDLVLNSEFVNVLNRALYIKTIENNQNFLKFLNLNRERLNYRIDREIRMVETTKLLLLNKIKFMYYFISIVSEPNDKRALENECNNDIDILVSIYMK